MLICYYQQINIVPNESLWVFENRYRSVIETVGIRSIFPLFWFDHCLMASIHHQTKQNVWCLVPMSDDLPLRRVQAVSDGSARMMAVKIVGNTTTDRRKRRRVGSIVISLWEHVTSHNSLSKTILQGACRAGDVVVDRGSAGWTIPKSGRPCPCQNC